MSKKEKGWNGLRFISQRSTAALTKYWLKNAFEFGLVGVALLALAWGCLALRLLRTIWGSPPGEERIFAVSVALMLVAIHGYGLGDFPDGIVQSAQLWLIPAALLATRGAAAYAQDDVTEEQA